ncbi:Ig heavy chain V region 1B43 [Bagarius yarrelli]|uniref:Ig heavy chain V region 1B43 n=1 Tax=Bagarius yarrelli TaxID=175774 RepID=A0A556TVK4_BAGYA|nr:Ig heavy chain V region 1B43 [Bagarius yarrelli]
MISTSLLLLLLAAIHCVQCVELIQSGSTVLTPDQSLTLTCKVSGYSLTDTAYCTHWIRQPAGKALEWVGCICGSGIKCVELVQPAVMLVKPGESFLVPCKVTGYSVTGGICTNWIRQKGRVLEWIGWYCNSGNTGSADSLKNNIHFSSESSSNTVTLHGQNFQTEDAAVYYCARDAQ